MESLYEKMKRDEMVLEPMNISFYAKMKKMFNEKRYCKVRLVLKEPKVLYPFTGKSKVDKVFDEKGRLCRYSIIRKPKKVYNLYIKKSTNDIYCFSNRLRARRVYPLWSLHIDDEDIKSLEFIKTDDFYNG